MTNLIDIQSQIEKLQKQATDIRAREFDKTVRDIVAQMQAFGITLKDLQKAMGKGKSRTKATSVPAKKAARKATGKKRSPQAGVPVSAKYRGPNGETWSGRGLMPRWLAALVTQGRSKEEFAIAGQ